jgi:phosphonoacetaldehyde hydrolase
LLEELSQMSSFRFQRRYAGPLKAVVLDWAGTTVDFGSRAPVLAVMEAFRRADVPVTLEQARGPMGMAKRDHLRVMLEMPEVARRWQQAHGREPASADIDRLYTQFLPLQKEILATNSQLIPGCKEAIDECRSRGIAIGSSTGYTQELMDVIVPLVRAQGYRPDAIVCASDVSPGRPAPWMCFENARRLGVYPMEAIVKVDDTTVGIEAGLNAGMWTVGIARSGNLVGLSEAELNRLAPQEQSKRAQAATAELYRCGAHFVADTIAELPQVLREIDTMLQRGMRP